MKIPPPLRNGMYAAYNAAFSRILSDRTPGRLPADGIALPGAGFTAIQMFRRRFLYGISRREGASSDAFRFARTRFGTRSSMLPQQVAAAMDAPAIRAGEA